jgi:1-aminocyclopropane-1-carboxylate synthase
MSSLSNRGNIASTTVLRTDMDKYFEALENTYHKENNPTGAFPLNVAENRLTWHLLKDKIQKITREKEIPEWVAGYTSGQGDIVFRESVANFLTECLTNCPIDPEKMAFSTGATSVIEMTALVLGDDGDVAAFPAPCYPVYKQDIGNIANLERYDIITHHDITSIQNGTLLSIEHLEKTKTDIESQDKNFKILVLTNPDNPTGIIYSREKMVEVADWCEANQVHLIVNEIYGLSLVDTSRPEIKADYSENIDFVSFAQIMEERKSDYLHLWYAFSKDFGISGFRVGLVYSHNELMIQAYENLNYSHLVSNYTQWILKEVLEDIDWVKSYIDINQKQLTEAYIVVVQSLKRVGLNYSPSRGSLFCWIDLSQFLTENTEAAENEFWLKMFDATGVLLTPGEGFGHTKKGHFRIVYPFVAIEDLKVAMNRFEEFIERLEL